jgi:hypothetical protein
MNNDNLIEGIQKKRLIFSVTTGRSGTAYLASIFGFAKGVYSVHEPVPEYADVLRQAQNEPAAAKQFLLEKKLPAILKTPGHIYVETSHLACKGFLEPLLQLGIVPDLIIHRRSSRDVALSMLKMGTIPGRSDKGRRFYLSPEDREVLELLEWQSLNDYQLCYWYCLEIERRAVLYKKLFITAGARVTETTLEGLKGFEGLTQCFSDLDLQIKFPSWLSRLRFLRSTGVKVNESLETKKDIGSPENIAELESLVDDIVATGRLNTVV